MPTRKSSKRIFADTGMTTRSESNQRVSERLHSDRALDRLIRASDKENVATEMITILGFLQEKQPLLSSVSSRGIEEYTHGYGFAFSCLRVFKDWCRVAPKKRETWCQTRGFRNRVLEGVCNFVTNSMKKLYAGAAAERTLFRSDIEISERSVLRLFLREFSRGLAVYSGSHHFGYLRLSDERNLHPQDAVTPTVPPKFAIFFTVKGNYAERQTVTRQSRKCIVYPPEDVILEHSEANGNDGELDRRISKLCNVVKVVRIQDICPAVMERLFASPDKVLQFKKAVKDATEINALKLYIDANPADDSIVLHMSDAASEESVVLDEVQSMIEREKERTMQEVAHFEYPKSGSGLTLKVQNNGKVKEVVIPAGTNRNRRKYTAMIYVCCAFPKTLDIQGMLGTYGEIVKIMSEHEESVKKSEPRLWGKILCETEMQRDDLINDVNEVWRFTRHVYLQSARPDLIPDGNVVEFLRLTVKSITKPVKHVRIIKRENNKWQQSVKYICIGNDPCKIWWLENGEGVFEPRHKYISDEKIIRAVRELFGEAYRVEVERTREPHGCFKRERLIHRNFIKAVPNGTTQYHITVKSAGEDELCDAGFIDLFDNGDKFLEAYESAKNSGQRLNHIWKTERHAAMVVAPDVFDCIIGGIDFVRKTVAEKRLNVCVDSSVTKSGLILIQVHGNDEAKVKIVSNVVKKVITPTVIKQDDCASHRRSSLFRYLTSHGGRKLIEKIQTVFSVNISQSQNDSLYIYGPPECRDGAKKKILTHFDKLPEAVHIAPPNDQLWVSLLKRVTNIYGKDFSELCRQSGVDSLYWDSRQGHFTAWGNPENVEACRTKIEMASNAVSTIVAKTDQATCVACFCPIEGVPFKLSLCGHPYCESCINVHIEVALKGRSLPIRCVQDGCNESAVLTDIGRSCNYTKERLRLLLDSGVSLYIAQSGDSCPVAHCPTPDCPGLYFASKNKHNGQEINCGVCGSSICDNCQVSPYHVSYTCALWKCRETLDEETAQWFSADANLRRVCPRCGIGIEKMYGCENVYCTNCKASICFICMDHFDDSDSCYAHLSKIHYN